MAVDGERVPEGKFGGATPPIGNARADVLAVLIIFAGCVVGSIHGHFFVEGLGMTTEVVAATPGNPFHTVAYALVCALVYLWSIELYGHAAALGAVSVAAATPALLTAAQYVPSDLPYAAAFFAVVYAQARNALDPSPQRVLLAAATYALARAAGAPWPVLVATSIGIVVVRVLAAERCERRPRVAHGALVSILLALGLGAGLTALVSVAGIVPLASATGTPATEPPADRITRWSALFPGHLNPRVHTVVDGRHFPMFLLAFLPAWPWHRRYSDGVVAVAIVLGGLFFGFHDRDDSTLLPVTPFLALLAGRAWDHHSTPSDRHRATILLLVQVLFVLFAPLFARL